MIGKYDIFTAHTIYLCGEKLMYDTRHVYVIKIVIYRRTKIMVDFLSFLNDTFFQFKLTERQLLCQRLTNQRF